MNGNTKAERMIAWLCGFSPTLAMMGLAPSLRWVLTGDTAHAKTDAKAFAELLRVSARDYISPPASAYREPIRDLVDPELPELRGRERDPLVGDIVEIEDGESGLVVRRGARPAVLPLPGPPKKGLQ